VSRHTVSYTFHESGSATNLIIDDQPASDIDGYRWDGDGTGAGRLTITGEDDFLAHITSIFQNTVVLREFTQVVAQNVQQLDTGVVGAE
jgi:hypothetical protein